MFKSGICILAAGLLTAGAYARDFVTPAGGTVAWEFDGSNSEIKGESWSWPATFDFQDICVIPVRMDVGFWIRVVDCKNLVLNLKQVEIHKYSGSVNAVIQCNVNVELSVVWAKDPDISLSGDLMTYGSSASVTPSLLDAPGGTVTISLTLSNVDIAGIVKNSARSISGGQNGVKVGTVTLRVRPNVKPVLAGA